MSVNNILQHLHNCDVVRKYLVSLGDTFIGTATILLLLRKFIIGRNVKFQLEIRRNEDVIFLLFNTYPLL